MPDICPEPGRQKETVAPLCRQGAEILLEGVVQSQDFLFPQVQQWRPQHKTMAVCFNIATQIRAVSTIFRNTQHPRKNANELLYSAR
eukprot:g37330.t1